MKNRGRRIVLILTAAFFARGLLLILALPIGDPLDEMFHSGYAEYVEARGKVPKEASEAMPVEGMRITSTLPRSTSFGGPRLSFKEYMAMPRDWQRELRRKAFTRLPEERGVFLGQNYESQQPPLMYLLGAVALRGPGARIDIRLFVLRLIAIAFAAAAVPLSYLFFRRLFPKYAALGATLAFVAFPGPGTFTSRFTNDALALPLAAGMLVLLADIARGRLTRRKSIALVAILALGSWTKLYFLVFFAAAPLAALLCPVDRRARTLRRALAATVLGFVLIVPWLVRQHSDTGDWLGLTETKAATRAGIGLMPRIAAIPHLLQPAFFSSVWRTFVYPGTWSAMGAPPSARWLALLGLILIFLLPQFRAAPRSARRARTWAGAALALVFFLLAQLAHLTTFAAVGMFAGGEGWYALILLPIVLAAAAAFGRSVPAWLFVAASALFVAADGICTWGLASVYAGGAKLGRFEVFSRVGLLDPSAAFLAAIAVAWLLAISLAAVLILSGKWSHSFKVKQRLSVG
jgi:ABC-type multidrug transport system fused ATPase/permease subunit